MKRFEVEQEEKWREIMKEVPTIHFDSEWGVKIIPPFGGAVARFLIRKTMEDGTEKHVCSVYLDWYDKLGFFGSPYYELYPYEDDTRRYALSDVKEMEEDIRKLFKELK